MNKQFITKATIALSTVIALAGATSVSAQSPVEQAKQEALASMKSAPKWTALTVDQVKAEIERQRKLGLDKTDEYVIQWGDTLSVLAKASGRTVDELAQLNNIKNKDLIYTGQTLKGVFSKSTSTATSTPKGQETATSTVATSATAETSTPVAPSVQVNLGTENSAPTVTVTTPEVTAPTTVENGGTATVEDNGTVTATTTATTPTEENGAGTSTEETTQPTDNGGATTEDTTTPPTDNGGTDTTDGGADTGGSTDDTNTPSIYRLGDIGNSGMEFATFEEADAWANAIYDEFTSQYFTLPAGANIMKDNEYNGYYVAPIMWSDNVTFTYTVVFYQ